MRLIYINMLPNSHDDIINAYLGYGAPSCIIMLDHLLSSNKETIAQILIRKIYL